MTKKDKEILIEEILNFCSSPKKAKQIAEHFGMNQNTIRAHFIYPMVKAGTLKRVEGVTLYIKTN